MSWRWTAWRLGISAFLIFHMAATLIWVIPPSLIKQRTMPSFAWYMLPLGLWQSWAMFAPDPQTETVALEAEVIDASGLRRIFEFPRVRDLSWWRKMPRFRHSKFACNLIMDEYAFQRELTARHVVRQVSPSPDAFPVEVNLYLQIDSSPPPGSGSTDPMLRPRLHALASYEYASAGEVRR